MAGWTNRGKYSVLDWAFRGATIPTNFFVALVTSATAPLVTHNTFGELTEITAGNGYATGGFSLTPNGTDFDSLVEDDTADKALLQIKDVAWTATGGNIPSAGNGARYAVLLDDNGTIGSRLVLAFWDLTSDRTVSDTQTLTLIDLELDLTE